MAESALPEQSFFGGLGLFTASGVPKAAYYALTLLSRLGDELLDRGEGWFVTRQAGEYRIMLCNYRHFSRLYAHGERFDMTFTDRYTPFSPEQALDVHLCLNNVPDGDYTVRETIVNRRWGSAFDKWVEMGAVEPDTPEELQTLAALSVPMRSRYLARAENKSLQIDALLDPLELRLITLTPAPRRSPEPG